MIGLIPAIYLNKVEKLPFTQCPYVFLLESKTLIPVDFRVNYILIAQMFHLDLSRQIHASGLRGTKKEGQIQESIDFLTNFKCLW